MLIEVDQAAKKEKFLKRLGRLNPLPTNEQETSRKNIFQIFRIVFTFKSSGILKINELIYEIAGYRNSVWKFS